MHLIGALHKPEYILGVAKKHGQAQVRSGSVQTRGFRPIPHT